MPPRIIDSNAMKNKEIKQAAAKKLKQDKKGEHVPAHTQLKAFRVSLSEEGSAIHVPLGNIVHWFPLITRPIVACDVLVKQTMLLEKNGWIDSYNIMARVLSEEDRIELAAIIHEMTLPDGGVELEGYAIWRHAKLHVKVPPHTHTHSHTLTHTHTHTHTHSRTQTHTPTGAL
jgi:ABC-type nickel/cobalt efflux system permease component RcnA